VFDRVALFNRGLIVLSGTVTELTAQVLGGGHVFDVEVRGADIADELAKVPGVVRVRPVGPDLYRLDCERDMRAQLSRQLARSNELLGISVAAPSLTEVYYRFFEGVRDAAQ